MKIFTELLIVSLIAQTIGTVSIHRYFQNLTDNYGKKFNVYLFYIYLGITVQFLIVATNIWILITLSN
jgi:large-conductance mechanosensitive channel